MLPFARPEVGRAEQAAVKAALLQQQLTNGPIVEDFEQQFATHCKAAHAIAVSSNTMGFLVLFRALPRRREFPIAAFSTYSFSSPVISARHAGYTTALLDIDDVSLCVLPEQAVQVCRSVQVLVVTHMAGAFCPEMGNMLAEADKQGVIVIEDAAHRHPTPLLGHAAVYSFYPTKPLTTCEGGMIVTNDDKLAARCRQLRNHGREGVEIMEPGYKATMPEPLAAMGLVQLHRQDELLQMRRMIAARYDHLLDGCPGITRPYMSTLFEHSWHLYIVRFESTIIRDLVREKMRGSGVETGHHYIPIHEMPFWASRDGGPRVGPVSEHESARALSLPVHHGVRGVERDVVDALFAAYDGWEAA